MKGCALRRDHTNSPNSHKKANFQHFGAGFCGRGAFFPFSFGFLMARARKSGWSESRVNSDISAENNCLAPQRTMFCRKHEIRLIWTDENSVPQNASAALSRRSALNAGEDAVKTFMRENPAQPIEKARFGRENPRKSKLFQPLNRGIPKRKGSEPRKPKPSSRTPSHCPAPERELA